MLTEGEKQERAQNRARAEAIETFLARYRLFLEGESEPNPSSDQRVLGARQLLVDAEKVLGERIPGAVDEIEGHATAFAAKKVLDEIDNPEVNDLVYDATKNNLGEAWKRCTDLLSDQGARSRISNNTLSFLDGLQALYAIAAGELPDSGEVVPG